MADRTPLKVTDRNAISDDDPFAELTRIMGFDPRQPVKPQAAAPEPAVADDFDIDLEKELMGEFGLNDEQAAVEAVNAPEAYAVSEDAVAAPSQDFAAQEAAPAHEHDLDFELDFGDAVEQSMQAETQWPAHDEPVHEAPAPVVAEEHDFGAHFDDAMAEVDMDFTASTERTDAVELSPVAFEHEHEAVEPMAVEQVAFASEPHDELYAEPAHDDSALDISLVEHFDDAVAVEAAPEAVEPTQPAEPIAAALYAEPERSLEDELNALLGNMGARVAKPVTQGATMSRSWASMVSASQTKALDPYAGAAVGYSAAQSAELQAAAEPEVHSEHAGMEADLDALLLHELSTSDMGGEAQPVVEDTHVDFAFDDADFAAFDADHEAERLAAAQPEPVPEMPSLARAWNLGTPITPAPEPVMAPGPAYEEPAYVEPAYEANAEEPAFEEAAYEEPAYEGEHPRTSAFDEVPDVETVDVPERVVALADDLDIPELAFDRDRPVTTAFDDLDAEFAGMLSDMNTAEATPVAPRATTSYDDEPYQAGFKQDAAADHGYSAQPAAQAPTFATAASYDDAGYDAQATRPFAPVDTYASDELDYDPELDDEMAIPQAGAMAQPPRRRGLLVAAVVGAVAIVGGIGAFALSPGGSSSDAPVIVKADNTPIKVKPEQPGGTVVPNQDNKVYDVVAKGTKLAAPSQEKLVASTQEPVDVNAAAPQNRVIDLTPSEPDDIAAAVAADTAAPIAKSEDRIDQNAQEADAASASRDVAVVAPRKVRTMIVKPDGTLAPREDVTPAPVVEASEPADPAPQRVAAAPAQADDLTGAVQADGNVAAAQPVAEPALKPVAKTQSATTPATVAAAPQRPSEQPVNIVGEVKPDQVASISPAAAAGSWSMQIASQPSEESAQSSYKDLARRYASVLDGHPANIVKAEIAGKGTYYRVRVPANSRNEAITLCESYKAAGGNCFVSK